MTRQEYLEYHNACIKKMTEITLRKNADYSGAGDSPFDNFTNVEKLNITTTETGFLTRIVDKISRLATFNKKGRLEVLDESVEDTILDCANYLILLAAYLKSKEQ